jgi:hypothetical protein
MILNLLIIASTLGKGALSALDDAHDDSEQAQGTPEDLDN